MLQDHYPFTSQTDLRGATFAAMREVCLGWAKSDGLSFTENGDDHLAVETSRGMVELRSVKETGLNCTVAAKDVRALFMVKSTVVSQVQAQMPAVAAEMQWTDGEVADPLPANFQFMRCTKIEQLGPVFLRATLEGDDVSSYGEDSIHFRLLQPSTEAETEWPTVAPNGSAKYSDGPGAPHKPVYSVRAVDYEKGQIVTDIFLHEGGKTMEWVEEVQSGSSDRDVIGIIGPMGGGVVSAKRSLMCSDETGFPAAARILENLPVDAVGDVFLEAEDGEACGYPFKFPKDMNVTWLKRADGDRLLDAAMAACPNYKGDSIWFAGEKEQARLLREATKDADHPSDTLRISGFWRVES